MAILGQDDKQLNPQDPNQQGQAGAQVGSGSPIGGSGESSAVGGGAAAAPAGTTPGGTGWTNIQSYLNANAGTGTSSKMMTDTIGGAIDNDKKQLDDSSSQVKQAGQASVDKNNMGTDTASKLISQAGSAYNYSGPQNAQYNQSVGQIKSTLNAQYDGPTTYDWSVSAPVQQYGQALNSNDQGQFQGLMRSLYDKSAGGQMNDGQYKLQSALDFSNPDVMQAKNDLGARYNALNTYALGADGKSGVVGDTRAALGADQSQFGANQTALKGWLGQSQTADQGKINQAVTDWQAADAALQDAGSASAAGLHGAENRTYIRPGAHGLQDAQSESLSLNADPFYDWNPGQVDTTTVGGVDDARGQFNALADLLGGQAIGKGAEAQHGNFSFDQQKYDDAWKNLAGPNWQRWK